MIGGQKNKVQNLTKPTIPKVIKAIKVYPILLLENIMLIIKYMVTTK